jgi:hypothetical protein
MMNPSVYLLFETLTAEDSFQYPLEGYAEEKKERGKTTWG